MHTGPSPVEGLVHMTEYYRRPGVLSQNLETSQFIVGGPVAGPVH
jgi:hypothetical protein